MKLTGKVLEVFEKWYEEVYIPINRPDYRKFGFFKVMEKFYRSTLSMQYGVYQDFFFTTDLFITTEWNNAHEVFRGECMSKYNGGSSSQGFKTRTEARIRSLEDACKMFNERTESHYTNQK